MSYWSVEYGRLKLPLERWRILSQCLHGLCDSCSMAGEILHMAGEKSAAVESRTNAAGTPHPPVPPLCHAPMPQAPPTPCPAVESRSNAAGLHNILPPVCGLKTPAAVTAVESRSALAVESRSKASALWSQLPTSLGLARPRAQGAVGWPAAVTLVN
jgi:hypothetical protein